MSSEIARDPGLGSVSHDDCDRQIADLNSGVNFQSDCVPRCSGADCCTMDDIVSNRYVTPELYYVNDTKC